MFKQVVQFFQRRITSRILPALRIRTRYTRALEGEIARLRAENRALVNSILGVAGAPPMRGFAGAPSFAPSAKGGNVHSLHEKERYRVASGAPSDAMNAPAPLRRRSWQQIGRALEIEDQRAARRERESDAETFPAPRIVVPRV